MVTRSAGPQSAGSKKDKQIILALDGGGVRGLSSLLVLQDLLRRINEVACSRNIKTLGPRDVFTIVGGTSTGGLIAIMLGKLGMSVEQCIQQYEELSSEIFGKCTKRGKVSFGFLKPKYFGKALEDRVQKLCVEHRNAPFLSVKTIDSEREISCSVVCRRYEDDGKKLVREAAFICSHECEADENFHCMVSDAARATSAAPFYFPPHIFGKPERKYIDGGLGLNNPSQVLWRHYYEFIDLNDQEFHQFRVVNIGTGSQPQNSSAARIGTKFSRRNMTSISDLFSFLKILTTEITDAENVAALLRFSSHANPNFEFDRFSPRNDLHKIGLDAHTELGQIKNLTYDYLKEEAVGKEMQAVAEALVNDYQARNWSYSVATPEAAATISPNESLTENLARRRVPQDTPIITPTRRNRGLRRSSIPAATNPPAPAARPRLTLEVPRTPSLRGSSVPTTDDTESIGRSPMAPPENTIEDNRSGGEEPVVIEEKTERRTTVQPDGRILIEEKIQRTIQGQISDLNALPGAHLLAGIGGEAISKSASPFSLHLET